MQELDERLTLEWATLAHCHYWQDTCRAAFAEAGEQAGIGEALEPPPVSIPVSTLWQLLAPAELAILIREGGHLSGCPLPP